MRPVKVLLIVFAALFLFGWVMALSRNVLGVPLLFSSGFILGLTVLIFAESIVKWSEARAIRRRTEWAKRWHMEKYVTITSSQSKLRFMTWAARAAGLIFAVASGLVLIGFLLAVINAR